ncbi:hypothetical protein HAX54_019462, partial [Datura stramonium]|nr:hypothetical protein [Datura stramonium]
TLDNKFEQHGMGMAYWRSRCNFSMAWCKRTGTLDKQLHDPTSQHGMGLEPHSLGVSWPWMHMLCGVAWCLAR